MDLDFDDQPSSHAAPTVRAGARFKPRGRPQLKKKQVSFSTSQTTLSTQTEEDPVSLDSKVSPSETIVPDSGTLSEENVDVLLRGVNSSMESSVLRSCNNVEASTFLDDPITQESTIFETREDEGRLDMESLDIVQEEGTTSSYVQHTGKFQPVPRLVDTVPEPHYSVDDNGFYSSGANEPEFMVNVESRNEFSTYGDRQEHEVTRETVPEMESGGWEHEEADNVSPFTNNTVTGEEEETCLGNNTVTGGEEENCLGNNTVTGEEEENCLGNNEEEVSGRGSKTGKSKRANARKRKNNTSEEPNKSNEEQEKKKFKHSSRRQKRTLEKELLETPDDEIRFLPIRDMLRLVEYKEWLEKKEAKGAVVPPTQESNGNASESQYYSQGFDAEDEFGIENSENQETNVVKPDSPVNYQTYMNKTPRSRWSKQDTELFYEGIREFGSNLSMIQQLFPDRTREQMKLKFKSEERKYPLKLNDALSSRSKHHTHFHNVIKKLQQEAAAAKEGEEEEEEGEAGAEAETTDVPENEEPEKSEETERASDGVAVVKETDGGDIGNGVKSDGGDIGNGVKSDGGNECDDDDEGDDDFWNSYKSDM